MTQNKPKDEIVEFYQSIGFTLVDIKSSVFRLKESTLVLQTDHKNHTVDASTILYSDAEKIYEKHQEEIEKAVREERERIRAFVLRETTVTLDSGVGIAKPEYQFGQKVIQALTPTKTDKQ